VFNFAHGWMMFFGALIFWQFYDTDPSGELTSGAILLAIILVISATGTLGFTTTGGGKRSPQQREPVPSADSLGITAQSSNRVSKAFREFVNNWQSGRIDRRRAIISSILGLVVLVIIIFLILQDEWPILRGTAAAFVFSLLLGLLIERFSIRPLLGQPILTAILMTLAIGFVIQGFTQVVWGPEDRKIDIFTNEARVETQVIPVFNPATAQMENRVTTQTVGGGTVSDYRIETEEWLGADVRLKRFLTWGFGIAMATFITFTIFFRFTPLGLAMRATAENQTLAESVGLRVRLMLALAWAMVAVMATIAGIIQGTGGTGVAILVVPALALRVFPAVLLGGLESIAGAMVGGLVIGIVEQLTIVFMDTSAAQQMAPFLVLIIVLIIRPDGLFGQRRIDRV
jgi:branched-chain amino acid transport system permease protein